MALSRLATFPSRMWEIFEAAKKGGSVSYPFPEKNFAVNFRHRFHSFRQALIAEQYPNAACLADMVCSLQESEGVHTLVFTSLAGPLQEITDELPIPQLEQGRAPTPVAGSDEPDAFDQALKSFIKKNSEGEGNG